MSTTAHAAWETLRPLIVGHNLTNDQAIAVEKLNHYFSEAGLGLPQLRRATIPNTGMMKIVPR